MVSMSSMKYIVPALLLLGVGFGAGVKYTGQGISVRGEIREDTGEFQFINPLLECDLGQEYIAQGKSRPSIAKIETLIKDKKALGDIAFASVYYRDLNNGPWIGVHEREKFFPASLMKVPLALYFFMAAESDPSILNRRVEIKNLIDAGDQYFKPEKTIEAGKTYTISELIEYALKYSDNRSAFVLADLAPEDRLNGILNYLHIEPPPADLGDYITVKDYAAFFRVLFNASLLNNESSEKVLSLLSTTMFNYGIVRDLPPDLVIAHKFGHKNDPTGMNQVHDCGIVYYPKNPYLICVMTRGADPNKLADSIAEISQLIYNEVDTQVKQFRK